MNNGTSVKKDNRDARYDFMKVVAMVAIVIWHINQHAATNGETVRKLG